ncbi:Telomere length regulation protein [Cavenderia fasciculata]|uniref:Telomere length regulation protein n=1 Tax=Cavenderia fasciculata TaxID=261658 RepID=F4QBF3_CACFS|nr:Telomere length regulation protein [Cavenderia fasciculata]EGG14925.1 Telomere length regulation protein [Cavenderia fasciculata]|eukprot:XP_004351441.1 Telomere length regulation protein [Cavenderia fasciculata]
MNSKQQQSQSNNSINHHQNSHQYNINNNNNNNNDDDDSNKHMNNQDSSSTSTSIPPLTLIIESLKSSGSNGSSSRNLTSIITSLGHLKQYFTSLSSLDQKVTITYNVILDLLLNDVYHHWYYALTDSDRNTFDWMFTSNDLYLLDSFLFLSFSLSKRDSNRDSSDDSDRGVIINQQLYYEYLLRILSTFNQKRLLQKVFNTLDQSGGVGGGGGNSIELLVQSISTIPDKVRNIQFKSKVSNNVHCFQHFESNLYFDRLFKDIIKELSIINNNNNNKTTNNSQQPIIIIEQFLSLLISKLLNIGYIDNVIELFVIPFIQEKKNIQLFTKIMINMYGSQIDKFQTKLVYNLYKYNENVYNNLIIVLKEIWYQQPTSMIIFQLTNKLLVKQYPNNLMSHNYFLNLLFSISENEKLNIETVREFNLSSLFVKGIETHLKSTIPLVNIQGMVLSEKISKFLTVSGDSNGLVFDHLSKKDRESINLDFNLVYQEEEEQKKKESEIMITPIDKKIQYQLELEKEFSQYDDPNMLVSLDNQDDEEEEEEIGRPKIEEINDDDEKEINDPDYLKPYNLNDDESDLKQVKKKLYLMDCLMEFQTNKHTPESWESALTSISSIVWNSKPDDLDEFSVPLTRSLLHLANEYGLENFEVIVQESIVALAIHSTGPVVDYLTSTFSKPNYSIGQRLTILSTLIDTAKYLSNYDSRVVNQLDQQRKQLQQDLQSSNKFIIDPNNNSNNNNNNVIGTIIRKREIRSDRVTKCSTMDLIGLDHHLFSRLIHALGLFIDCAGNSPSTRSMSRELIHFIWPYRYQEDQSIKRAILFSISRVFYLLDKDIITSDYQDELEEIIQYLICINI